MTYAQFKAEWQGRRVDYDHVYYYQCVDLILEYLKEVAGVGSGVWGNAIDYANHPTPAFSSVVDRVGDYKAGDIVVLRGLAGNPYGHIAIVDSDGGGGMLEQNGATGGGSGTGRDAIGVFRAVPKDRVAAIYRLKALEGGQPSAGGGTAHVQKECYVRAAPNTAAALAGSRVLEAGDTFQYQSKVAGQNVGGNSTWYHSTKGNYVWSGNVTG